MSKISGHWTKYDVFTPAFVRCLAADRTPGKSVALTDEQIAERSGLTVSAVQKIYWGMSWDSVTCGDMKKFVVACNVDFGDPEVMKVLSRRLGADSGFRWKHLRESSNYKMFEQLLKHALTEIQ
jgi:hypothetical protein